jgi:hypothetical protein
MLSLSQPSLDLALLIGRAVFLVFCFGLAAYTFTRWRRAAAQTEDLFFQQNSMILGRLIAIEEQLASNQTQLASTREQLASLAAHAERMGETLQDSEQRRIPAAASGATPSYQIAIRLARSGAPREELMTSCGLSRQEAELVQRLHAPSRTKLAVAS